MTRFIVRRFLRSVVVFAVLIVLIFMVTHVIGDPVARQLPLDASPEQFERRRATLGLDRPVAEQFREYVAGAVRFDFGNSHSMNRPAMEVVLERLPRSFVLIGAGMGLAAILGVPLGIAMALSRRRWVDRLGNVISLVQLSVPQFWVGILLILVFAVWLGWFPTSGIGSLSHLVLPAITLALSTAGRTAQITQSTLRDELRTPYVRQAYAKGLPAKRVLIHALRNVAVPVTTVFGYETVTALAGYTILVEVVFSWPGVGLLLAQAATRLDLPLTGATAVTVAAIVIVANATVDSLQRVLDPRIAAGAS